MSKWTDKLLKAPSDNVVIQLFRYGFVGGVAFLVDYGAMVLLTEWFGLNYLLSATISFILGLTTNYILSVSWVFDKRKVSNRWAEFLLFAAIGVVGLGLNSLFMYLCTDKWGVHYMISKVIATAIVFFWNFFVRRFTLFRHDNCTNP